LRQLFELRPLVVLGGISYSLYLIHAPVLAGLVFALRAIGCPSDAQAYLDLTIGPILSIAVAAGFYLIFERPFLATSRASRALHLGDQGKAKS
jgi:peptidoglycan/LPS O-acetylase OafA/YrhL